MIRKSIPLALSGMLCWSGLSIAQEGESPPLPTDDFGKWSFTFSAAATSAAIKIVDSEVELPEELAESDVEAALSNELTASSTILSGMVGYRILPFAEVYARAGLISTDTETGVTISGAPNGPFSDLFDGPIMIDRETSRDVDGFSLGLGASTYMPITEIAGDTLAGYGTFQYAWNRFDETLSSEAAITSFGFVYPVNFDRQNIVYRFGGSYNWISRDVDQALALNGEDIRVRVTQEFEDPWAVEAGMGIPLTQNTLLGLGGWHQLSG